MPHTESLHSIQSIHIRWRAFTEVASGGIGPLGSLVSRWPDFDPTESEATVVLGKTDRGEFVDLWAIWSYRAGKEVYVGDQGALHPLGRDVPFCWPGLGRLVERRWLWSDIKPCWLLANPTIGQPSWRKQAVDEGFQIASGAALRHRMALLPMNAPVYHLTDISMQSMIQYSRAWRTDSIKFHNRRIPLYNDTRDTPMVERMLAERLVPYAGDDPWMPPTLPPPPPGPTLVLIKPSGTEAAP